MPGDDLSLRRARNIRRALVALIDRSQIRPRKYPHLESISLALIARMAELHETICLLASRKRLRDAVILARTLCEANITLYWLTNEQESDQRIDRYVTFGGQVQLLNMERVKKYFRYDYVPKNKLELDLLEDARVRFQNDRYKWNNVPISKMAAERDIYDPVSTGTPPSMQPVYELFYYWCSLLAHPCIKAIENFLPRWGVPFKCFQPSAHQTVPEMHVVFLSTCWLFSMAVRISKITLVRKGDQLDQIWERLKRK
ncbi:MAG: DUF5677 domain-containing protein [Terriglobia bacterium]